MEIYKKLFRKLSYDQISSLKFIKVYFWHINFIKTIYLNLRILPMKDALKLPIIVGYNVRLMSIGKILIKNRKYTGMISLGVVRIDTLDNISENLTFANYGTLVFNGRSKIHPGAKIFIKKNAEMNFNHRVSIGSNSKIACYKSISIGNNCSISWNCQIFDTDFHFLSKTTNEKIYERTKPVIIGDNVFIGNSCTIGKGAILPNGSVVSCCSKLNGRFVAEGENLLISGNPAQVVSKGFNIIGSGWFPEKEHEIAKMLEH